jgi:ATP-dependent exoDNAse (exonuclease V) beta subunit
MLSDVEGRALIAAALHDTLIVEAAAGTGKTTELVNRIIAVLGEGLTEMRGIVAVTFTEKAAGELRLRLRQRLEHERREASGERAQRFERAVQHLEEAHVSTIHGFCVDLLRERPVEAGVDPLFSVLTEGQATGLLAETFDAWLRARLEAPPEGVRRSLRRATRWGGETGDDGPLARLRRAVIELSQWRDFRAPWSRQPFERAHHLRVLTDLLHAVADVSATPASIRDNLFADTAPVRALSDELRRSADLGAPVDDDGLEGRFVELARNRTLLKARKGSGSSYGPGVPRATVLSARDGLLEALEDFRLRADADLAAALHVELLGCLDEYEARKRADGALDFLDLLVRARDLVRNDRSVREHFQARFSRIFVDEFQDTDPLQAELLLLLVADDAAETDWRRVRPRPGKLFVVGDPKQSVYRFRRADVAVYREVCEQLERVGARRVELRRSFRSVPALQHFVNAAFASVMDGDVARQQARYVALEPTRQEEGQQPAVVALPVPRPYGTKYLSGRAIEESLPDAVGAFLRWLLADSGWQVTERQGGTSRRVPVQARHVCVLFRRFVSFGEDVTRPYLDALEVRGVRHLLVGGRAFHEREEIETLKAALTAIEWPDDPLSVFATLRGALFAIGDEELLEFVDRGGRLHPFAAPPELPGRLAPIVEALGLLKALHIQRNRRPIVDTVTALLTRTRAHVGFVLRPNGEQVLANVLHVGELARQYETEGGMSFRGFVDSLRAESAEQRAAEAPILEEGSDGVRLMTVHKAKGLEFPVVVLADITARLTPGEPGRAIDAARDLCALRLGGWAPMDLVERQEQERAREQAEGERVAYVAATRARDLLVVGAVGDGPYEGGWTTPLGAALYPPFEQRRAPEAAPACPVFASRDSVRERPDGEPAGPGTVAPGRHRWGPPDAPCDVVWWSPEESVLPPQEAGLAGLRREDLVVKDVPVAVLQRYLQDYRSWQEGHRSALERGLVPTHDVRTITDVSADPDVPGLGAVDVQEEALDAAGARPYGPRFGALVHAVMAEVPLDSRQRPQELVRRLAETQARVLGAPLEEAHAAELLVHRALEHPLLRAASAADAAGGCLREVPVTWTLPSGTLVEGTVDLAFEDAEGFVLVDFKTDRDQAAADTYRRQVQIYAAALAAATTRPVRGVLLWL